MVIDIAEYRRLQGGVDDFKNLLLSAPDLDLLEIDRLSSRTQTIDLH